MAYAKDIMTEKVMSLPASTDILEAVNVFMTKRFTSVPVTTGTGDLAGQLTEIVLIRLLVLSKGQPDKFKKLAHCLDLLEKPVFVQPSDSVASVLKSVMQSPTKRVFVSVNNHNIQGIISPKDLLRALVSNDKTADAIQGQLEKAT